MSSTVAMRSCGSGRRSSWASAGGACSERSGVQPEVCHLNEGHAALAVLERARTHMVDQAHAFELALTITRAGNLFTTHTAVEAGFDRFAPELLAKDLACTPIMNCASP